MIGKFAKRLGIKPQALSAKICYRLDVLPESTRDIVGQLNRALVDHGIDPDEFVDTKLRGGFPGTDIYLNFRTKEGGVYSESFVDSTDMATSDARDVRSGCFKTFPATKFFEYYVLDSPLTFIPSEVYGADPLAGAGGAAEPDGAGGAEMPGAAGPR